MLAERKSDCGLRFNFRTAALAFTFTAAALGQSAADVIIYGGTPGGLAAARAVVREGATAIVVEPTSHIGGMVTGGIAITDTATPHYVGGLAGEYFDAIAAENSRLYGKSPEPKLLFRGASIPWRAPRPWDLEPKTARRLFEAWVAEDKYRLIKGQRVASVAKSGARIVSIKLTGGETLSGKVFVDASYEGDLMAKAKVSYTYGRESSAQYGEKLAGVREPHFVKNYTDEEYRTPTIAYQHHGQFGADIPVRGKDGKLLWGIEPAGNLPVGSADKRIQAYCYRLIATQRADLKLPWPKPDHYYPERYELLLRYVLAHPDMTFTRLVHLGAIPNGKFDLNASGPFSIDYVGGNFGYPDADYPKRDRMLHDHIDYEKGFLWFLANDVRVPKLIRDEANSWGLAKDEFTDTDNWPVQPYLRESRRMVGTYVMTEADVLTNNTKSDSVGLGNFVLDSHWVRRIATAAGFARVEGHLDESIRLDEHPYEIPYRSMLPKSEQCENLLVPVCVSATHVAICTIRMEPVYMELGHAAGVAAVMALRSGGSIHSVDVRSLTGKLTTQKAILHKADRKH